MQRVIKFRGRRLFSPGQGSWVYGSLVLLPNGADIRDLDYHGEERGACVDMASVCQYTGYDDHKDNPIYEGDIIQVTYDYPTQDSDVKETVSYIVRFEEGQWCLVPLYYGSGRHRGSLHETMVDLTASGITVIGNEYENSDMIREYR